MFLALREMYLKMTQPTNGIIIVDKITSLLCLGIPVNKVIRFAQNLQALAWESQSTLVTLSAARLQLGLRKQAGLFVNKRYVGQSDIFQKIADY